MNENDIKQKVELDLLLGDIKDLSSCVPLITNPSDLITASEFLTDKHLFQGDKTNTAFVADVYAHILANKHCPKELYLQILNIKDIEEFKNYEILREFSKIIKPQKEDTQNPYLASYYSDIASGVTDFIESVIVHPILSKILSKYEETSPISEFKLDYEILNCWDKVLQLINPKPLNTGEIKTSRKYGFSTINPDLSFHGQLNSLHQKNNPYYRQESVFNPNIKIHKHSIPYNLEFLIPNEKDTNKYANLLKAVLFEKSITNDLKFFRKMILKSSIEHLGIHFYPVGNSVPVNHLAWEKINNHSQQETMSHLILSKKPIEILEIKAANELIEMGKVDFI